ncbi:uncharacterized protein LOC132707785 isoform X2 [Cylas formicarius]|uniref:uncharacterized protein LOC132707785 isoform X2 n=1 Tax=Cylas formicarius TaxID=197179 RepID=UPI00295838B6|nr:uncharacterized protein LOC132707785 isoform X2 [Cylas formicarius]
MIYGILVVALAITFSEKADGARDPNLNNTAVNATSLTVPPLVDKLAEIARQRLKKLKVVEVVEPFVELSEEAFLIEVPPLVIDEGDDEEEEHKDDVVDAKEEDENGVKPA